MVNEIKKSIYYDYDSNPGTQDATNKQILEVLLLYAKRSFMHRHLRETHYSLAVVGGLATAYSHGTESEGKSIH